ncbi:TrmH family RNA methyltransferase, partial [Acidobacteriota bacterium]
MAKISRLNPILEALQANPDKIQRISIQRDAHRPKLHAIVQLAKEKGVPLDIVPKQNLDRQDPSHQGALAVLTPQAYVSLADVLGRSENPFFLLLDGITDPQNLGAIIRSAECGGVDGIVLPERRSA